MSRTDVSDLRSYPQGDDLDPCDPGEHVLTYDDDRFPAGRGCLECGLSVQALANWVGHDMSRWSG